MRKKKRLDIWNKEKEIVEIYLKEKKNLEELSEIFNCSKTLIKIILMKNSIEIRPIKYYFTGRPSPMKGKKYPNLSGENHRLYNKTYEEAYGEEKTEQLKRKMRDKKLGKPQFHNRRKDIDKKKDEILNLYNKSKGVMEIAKLMNCDFCVIKRILLENNIKIRPLNFYTKGKSSPLKIIQNEQEVIDMYINQNIPGTQIAKRFNCASSTIYGVLKKNNIKIKPSGFFQIGQIPWSKGLTKETDERIRKLSKTMGGHKHSRETIEKNRIAHKKLMANPEYKERVIKKSMKAMKIKPNKPEKIMINLIEKHNLPFNYVGDAKIWFRGENHMFNPDFLSKNPKHIIELFGDYWHTLPKVEERDKERLKTYSKYGYKTLIIWESELKNPIQVINRIKEFIR